MDQNVQDYLFDLQGYLVLENAISAADLREMNQWIDNHESYVEEPWSENDNPRERSRWIGNVETHTYNEENGVNFQNIIEGGPVFERLIDYPAWIDLVKKYRSTPSSMGFPSTRTFSMSVVPAVSSTYTAVDMSRSVI